MNDHSVAITILQQSILLFLLFGSVLGLLLGLLLLLAPASARRLSAIANRWISLRRPTRPLEIPRSADRFFYRHHRAMGLFILFSAGYVLYRFAFSFEFAKAVTVLSKLSGSVAITSWLLEATLCFFLPVSLLLILVGAVMALKPSLLRSLEHHANRWYSTRKALQSLDIQHQFIDHAVLHRPRLFGLLLLSGAGYTLVVLLVLILSKEP